MIRHRAVLRAEKHEVAAVARVGLAEPGAVRQIGDWMKAVTAKILRAAAPVIRRAEGGGPGGEKDAGLAARVEGRSDQLARIVGAGFSKLLGEDLDRLFPGDALPFGIDVETLFRIGAAHRMPHPGGIVKRHEAGVSFGAGLTPVLRAVRLPFDLNDHAVDAVYPDAAGVPAHETGGFDPDVFFDGLRL